MMHCWNEDPDDRPAFEELHETFLAMIADQVSCIHSIFVACKVSFLLFEVVPSAC